MHLFFAVSIHFLNIKKSYRNCIPREFFSDYRNCSRQSINARKSARWPSLMQTQPLESFHAFITLLTSNQTLSTKYNQGQSLSLNDEKKNVSKRRWLFFVKNLNFCSKTLLSTKPHLQSQFLRLKT